MTHAAARRFRRFAVGATLLGASAVAIRRPDVSAAEERLFRWANGAGEGPRIAIRSVMQAGTFATVPAVATVALLTGRRALALRVLAAGTAAWVGAKAIKPLGGRDRPAGVLAEVTLRERIQGDLGWVSGHTAVATALALVLAEDLPGRAGPPLAAIAVLTGYGRMYVGAHLPHDVVGGAGLGMVVAALTPGGRRG